MIHLVIFFRHKGDSLGFCVLPDLDVNVPEALSKLMYKWSSYMRMSIYSYDK